MTSPKPTPAAAAPVAIDVAKQRNEVLIEMSHTRRRRLTVSNCRAEHDRLVAELQALALPIVVGLEPTGHYHRPLAWRLGQAGKNELGLDHNETRSWHGWYRQVSLVMLAFAMMASIRHHANAMPPPKNGSPDPAATDGKTSASLIRWSIQEIRRISIRLAQPRIKPAHVIAWSIWRRAHQAIARQTHLKQKLQP